MPQAGRPNVSQASWHVHAVDWAVDRVPESTTALSSRSTGCQRANKLSLGGRPTALTAIIIVIDDQPQPNRIASFGF